MAGRSASVLEDLERLRDSYGGDAARRKLGMLQVLEKHRLARSKEVLRLHEALCFLRAYPDGPAVLGQVETMLAAFDRRRDLRRYRKTLANTGIAGTLIRYPFFWFTAEWLARRWPERISIDWRGFDKKDKIEDALRLILHYAESPAIDELACSPKEWMRRLKGKSETDAYFLVRRFGAYPGNAFAREAFYESFAIPLNLKPGPDTPNRTRARYPGSRVVFQTRPLSRVRPRLRTAIPRCNVSVKTLPPAEGQRLIYLAREAMVTRSRDLDAFEHADERDVRLVDCGGGLQFAAIGVRPERRLLLESLYGFLTLKNGVPIGYVLATALFQSSEVAFNVFETFRGGEAATVLCAVLAMVRRIFGSDTFTIDPYQLGYANTEGLRSGAWWFYYKMGFRPYDEDVRRVLRGELARMKKRPGHRSDLTTLSKLASENLYLHMDRPRKDVLGIISLGDIGLKVARTIADRFGADRERAATVFSREAANLLEVRSLRGFSPAEVLAWQRWSPLVMSIQGLDRWSRAEKHALVEIIRAKGGTRESDFVRLFDRHRRLRQAVLRLAKEDQA